MNELMYPYVKRACKLDSDVRLCRNRYIGIELHKKNCLQVAANERVMDIKIF